MIKAWVLFFLGTGAYFITRYGNKRNKSRDFDLKFWLNDNWPELSVAFIVDLAMTLLILDPATQIDMSGVAWWPQWLTLPIAAAIAFFLGYGGGAIVYGAFKGKADRMLTRYKKEEEEEKIKATHE